MKNSWMIVLIGLVALAAFAIGRPSSESQRMSDTGIGKWNIFQAADGSVILINTEDGKTWLATKKDPSLHWRKCERE